MAVVTFLGEVRKSAGRTTVDVKADSVRDLLIALGKVVSPSFASLLFKNETLQPDVEVLINGRNIEFLQMLDTPLGSADQVTVFYSGVRGFPGG